MLEANGNSNRITRKYLDSLLIETRYMNAKNPTTEFELFGRQFASPIMTAALSHLDHFMFEGATAQFAQGAAQAGAILWLGMSGNEEVEMCASAGTSMIEIIKPYSDRDLIREKIRHAEETGLLAVGIDIDHPFAEDGSPDNVDGYEMTALTTAELREICSASGLPVIAKGILSVYDAQEAVGAGAAGLVLSHHNNRIEYAVPALMMLPEIRKHVPEELPIFVDGDIRTGMDAFKALCLGAKAVCIGRPLMTAIKQAGADGVARYLRQAGDELKKAMAYAGCADLSMPNPSMIHQVNWLS